MQHDDETVSFSRGGGRVDMISRFTYFIIIIHFVFILFFSFGMLCTLTFFPPYCFGDNRAAGVAGGGRGVHMIDDPRGAKRNAPGNLHTDR